MEGLVQNKIIKSHNTQFHNNLDINISLKVSKLNDLLTKTPAVC